MSNFVFEKDGPVRLVIKAEGDIYRLFLDGTPVAEVAKAPRASQSRTLPDGSKLVLEYRPAIFGEDWHITRDGVSLPGSAGTVENKVAQATGAFAFMAAQSVLTGILALAGVSFIRSLGVDYWIFLDALLFGVIAWRTHRRSLIAAIIGFVVACISFVRALALVEGARGGSHSSAPFVLRIMLLLVIARAIWALWLQGRGGAATTGDGRR